MKNASKLFNPHPESIRPPQSKVLCVEGDKASLSAHVDSLKGELLSKSTELEEKQHQYEKLQLQFSEAGQKHNKDLENVGIQLAQLQAQVDALENTFDRLQYINFDFISSYE